MCRGRSGHWPGGDPELDTVQEKVHQPTLLQAIIETIQTMLKDAQHRSFLSCSRQYCWILILLCIKYFSSNTIIILGGGHMEPEAGQSIDQSEMMSTVVT